MNIEEVGIEMEMEQLNIKGVEEDAVNGDGDGDVGSCIKFKSLACCSGKHTGNDTAITQEVEATSCCCLGKVLFCKKGGEDRKVNIEEVEIEMERLSVEEDAVVEPDSRGDTSGWRCTRWFREAWLYTKLFSGKETAKKEESTAGEDFEGVQLYFDAEDSVN